MPAPACACWPACSTAQPFDSVLVGDESLSRRPMRRVTRPLATMGARIDPEGGLPPLRIHGGQRLTGIDYTLEVASAQVKSAVLLAGLYADGDTVVREPHPTRDYTERMLKAFGVDIEFSPGFARLRGGQRLKATDIAVPADFSSAAFFLVAASIIPGSELRLRAVGLNPRRTGLLQALRLMGADITEENASEHGGEPVADLVVRHAPLRGIEVPEALVPDMIDEFAALFVAAAAADGPTVVRGAAELRVKESDRLASMANGLRALGLRVDETQIAPRFRYLQGRHGQFALRDLHIRWRSTPVAMARCASVMWRTWRPRFRTTTHWRRVRDSRCGRRDAAVSCRSDVSRDRSWGLQRAFVRHLRLQALVERIRVSTSPGRDYSRSYRKSCVKRGTPCPRSSFLSSSAPYRARCSA